MRGSASLLPESALTAESVQGTALAFQSVHNIHGGHRLPLGVFRVRNSITDHVLQEYLQHATGLLVDETGDALNAATTSQTPDSWLGDSLDVITENLPVTLGASLSKSLSSFAATRHVDSMTDTD